MLEQERKVSVGGKTHRANAYSNSNDRGQRNKVTICSEERVEHLLSSQDCILLFYLQIEAVKVLTVFQQGWNNLPVPESRFDPIKVFPVVPSDIGTFFHLTLQVRTDMLGRLIIFGIRVFWSQIHM